MAGCGAAAHRSGISHQALRTAISFFASTNIQLYSGETGATGFPQLAVFGFLRFVSAGTSLTVEVT